MEGIKDNRALWKKMEKVKTLTDPRLSHLDLFSLTFPEKQTGVAGYFKN